MAVTQKTYTSYSELTADMTAIWNWADISDKSLSVGPAKVFWFDEDKKYGIIVFENSVYNAITIGIYINDTDTYNYTEGNNSELTIRFEKTNNALIISAIAGTSISAINCAKYIICNGVNMASGTEGKILIYLGSKSSNNQLAFCAPDVQSLTSEAAQNSNANTNAKTTNLIPFYSTDSAFVTKNVFQSLCENIPSWYFGDVYINGNPYLMSGSVFILY